MGMNTVGFLLLVVLVALLIFFFCRSMGLWTTTIAWILSEREEKAALTRLKGHYNANGYLVGSDSDIRLDAGGSFRRFESVDSDSALEYAGGPIPPQPLRPAPVPPPLPPPPLEEIIVGGNEIELGDGVVTSGGCPLQRAMSCESVCSDTSVAVADLAEPNVTGYLCIGIEYDSECGDLVVSVIEAKDLVCREHNSPLLDTFVCVYLQPEKSANMQTRTYRSSNSPSYKEKFLFGLDLADFSRSWLMFHVYSVQREASTLLGEAQIMLTDVPTKQPITTWLTLADSNQGENNMGEILFSLSYLPTAERLTVVVVKARNLKFPNLNFDTFVKDIQSQKGGKLHLPSSVVSCVLFLWNMLYCDNPQSLRLKMASKRRNMFHKNKTQETTEEGRCNLPPFCENHNSLKIPTLPSPVKVLRFLVPESVTDAWLLTSDNVVQVYLLCNGKKVHKKKTSTKRTDPCPIFNEAMIFSVPCNSLQVRVTVAGTETGRNGGVYNIGHVILGSQSVGKALSHWNQMLASLRKPVAMWHPLRQKPVHQA